MPIIEQQPELIPPEVETSQARAPVEPKVISQLPRQELVEDIDGYQFLDLCKRESITKEIRITRIDVGSANALYTVMYTVLPKQETYPE